MCQLHSFQVRRSTAVIPSLANGSNRIGLLELPFARSARRAIRLLRFCPACIRSARLSGDRFEAYSSSSTPFVCWRRFYGARGAASRGPKVYDAHDVRPSGCRRLPYYLDRMEHMFYNDSVRRFSDFLPYLRNHPVFGAVAFVPPIESRVNSSGSWSLPRKDYPSFQPSFIFGYKISNY